MVEILSTVLIGIGLFLAFLAAARSVSSLSSQPGNSPIDQAVRNSPGRSLPMRARVYLSEAELDWEFQDVVVWVIAAATVLTMVGLTLGMTPGWLFVALVLAPALFVAALGIRRSIRMGQFRRQFPEVVTIMARAVRAGLGVEESFQLGEQAARGRLRDELGKCAAQLRMGRSLPSALQSFATRSGLREVGLLATILSVHHGTGGPLAEALERLSLLLRDQLMFRQQVLAATSGGRFSAFVIAPAAPLIFCFLMITAPEHVGIFFDKPLGRTFLILGTVLNTVGVLWIYFLVKPKN